ncbi:MAG TPA: hypothetical protein DCY88_24210 [Cyanobacteria bacterium UBA11372]|nr:hypothetical protein [Cyanobacteria bacterium UBA11372]HBE52639.1 hypothetical protein [Cyanobacteria bacterium UBA11369]
MVGFHYRSTQPTITTITYTNIPHPEGWGVTNRATPTRAKESSPYERKEPNDRSNSSKIPEPRFLEETGVLKT